MRWGWIHGRLLWLLASLISLTFANDSLSDTLFRQVWQDYASDVRPVCGGYPSSVAVTLGIALRQLMDLDEPKQMLMTCVWFRLAWNDCRLTWNTTEFGGVERVTVPRERVWTPDLTLYDNAESKLGELEEYRITVHHTGEIRSLVPVVIKSMCKLDVSMFPFDHQSCNLTFGSWAYAGSELNLTAAINPTDLTSFIEHGEWDLAKLTVTSIAPNFGGEVYTQVVFTLHLRRKALFYGINLLFPSVVMKCLALAGFILPPDSGEKVNLEITVLLSLSVFQLVVLDSMPATSENFPVIAIYFMCAMILVSLSCMKTVFVLNLHFTKHHAHLPASIGTFMTGRFGKLFGVEKLLLAAREKLLLVETAKASSSTRNDDNSRYISQSNPLGTGASDGVSGFHNNLFYESSADVPSRFANRGAGRHFNSITPQNFSQTEMTQLVQTARKMLDHLRRVSESKDKKLATELHLLEWRIFAILLDRIFLIVFVCLTLTLLLTVYCIIAS